MKINLETIEKLNPCRDRLENYKRRYGASDFTLEDFLNLDKITYNDKVWVAARLFTKKQSVLWAVKCAESVLHIFEEKYPNEAGYRKFLEEIKKGDLEDTNRPRLYRPSSEYPDDAYYACYSSYATYCAAYAIHIDYADFTINEHAWFAIIAARYAITAATISVFDIEAARKQQEELNLKFILEAYNETKGE